MIFRNVDICCIIYTAFVISALLKPQTSLGDCDLTNDVSVQTAGSVVQHGPDCDAVSPPTVYPIIDVSISSYEMAFVFFSPEASCCPVGTCSSTSLTYSKPTPLATRSLDCV